MKKSAILLLFIFFLTHSYGQSNTPVDTSALRKTVKEQAEKMGQLLLKKKYKAYNQYIHPKLVETLGGHEKMEQVLAEETSRMESRNIHLASVTVDTPSAIHSSNGELQCIVTQTLELKGLTGDYSKKNRSVMLAVSSDQGKNWTFLEISNKDIDEIKKYIPNLSSELVIPPKQTRPSR